MATVHDVAKYILERMGPLTTMKLQKLAYYSQAWHLVWCERELFPEQIEAWANGPVSPALYQTHRGHFQVSATQIAAGSSESLLPEERSTVEAVLNFYGQKTGQWLSDLSHREDPWRRVRERAGVLAGQRCSETITTAEMAWYYAGLHQ